MKLFLSVFARAAIASGALTCVVLPTVTAQSLASGVSTKGASDAISLAQATEAAWQRAVRARETGGDALVARADQVAASSPWAAQPALELSHRDDRWLGSPGGRESEAGLVWPLWLPGQRDARKAAAAVGLDLAEAAEQAGRLHVAGLVREAAWNLAAQRTEVDLADARTRYLREVADDVQRRVAAGDLAPTDALAARSELLAAHTIAVETHLRLKEAWSAWRMLTGVQAPPAVFQASAELPPFEPNGHPEARLADLAVELARRRLALVDISRGAPPDLMLRLRQDSPGRGEPSQSSLGIGIRIPLGSDARNEPLRAGAMRELEIARATAELLRERLAAEAGLARSAVLAAQQQLESERVRVDLLHERATLIGRSFDAGETSLPELLRTLVAAAEAERNYARQQAALGLARARLSQAWGILP